MIDFNKCPYMPHHGGCHYPICPATCSGREKCCDRRSEKDGEWVCDHCKSLWYGGLAETDWRPSTCPSYSGSRPASNSEAK